MKLDTKKITNIEWDQVDPSDYPDFSDAYAMTFDYGDREATEDEIDFFNDNLISHFHEQIFDSLL